MSEAEWVICSDPQRMIAAVLGSTLSRLISSWFDRTGDKARQRKLRLFICACCRTDWWEILHEAGKRAVEVAERFADGFATHEELRLARVTADRVLYEETGNESWWQRLNNRIVADWLDGNLSAAVEACGLKIRESMLQFFVAYSAQCGLIRDIFGNPFRKPPVVNPAWLAWNDGSISKMAKALYADRAFDRLPILADALEDAGCDNADILAHCRGPGPHVRGCWVVDLILDKK